MILKEVDNISTTDKFIKVGHHAEKQMAYYLRNEFKETQDVLVLNGIRLESNNDSAQIDHLIIHKYGFIIIESKHISGTVEINELGEWSLLGSPKGMPSPIKQAERQASFLKKYLSKYIPKLHRNQLKNRLVDTPFKEVPVDVLVAISDTTNITRHGSKGMDNICKAEAIADKVKATINNFQSQDNFLNLKWAPLPLKLNRKTLDEIAAIILKGNRPISSYPTNNVQNTDSTNYRQFQCRKCGSESTKILYGEFDGKRGYYFKCQKCDGGMSIKEYCSKCGQLSKLRKAVNQFYIECKTCGISKLFFTNTTSDGAPL